MLTKPVTKFRIAHFQERLFTLVERPYPRLIAVNM